MSDSPVQVIVAAFNSPEGAGLVMDEIKQGKRDGLIGIIDAAVVVKNAEGKLKITDAKRRSRKGLVTGGVVGGLIGLVLAPPAVAVAAGGGVIGALVGKLRSAPIKAEMKDLGSALQPNTSAIIAVIEHTWVEKLEAALTAAGASLIREAIKTDIAAQLEAGGNVLYTAGAGPDALGAARVAQTGDSLSVGGLAMTDDGLFLDSAEIILSGEATDEEEDTSSSMV